MRMVGEIEAIFWYPGCLIRTLQPPTFWINFVTNLSLVIAVSLILPIATEGNTPLNTLLSQGWIFIFFHQDFMGRIFEIQEVREGFCSCIMQKFWTKKLNFVITNVEEIDGFFKIDSFGRIFNSLKFLGKIFIYLKKHSPRLNVFLIGVATLGSGLIRGPTKTMLLKILGSAMAA